MRDISNRAAGVRTPAAQKPPQVQQPSVDLDQLVEVVHQRLTQKVSAEQQFQQELAQRRGTIITNTRAAIEKISAIRMLDKLSQTAPNMLTDEQLRKLPEWRKQSEELQNELESQMADGAMAQEQLIEGLIDAAAADPEVAAAIIEEQTGEQVSPQEVEALANSTAGAMIGADSPDEATKTSAKNVLSGLQGLDPIVAEVVRRMAMVKISIRREMDRQRAEQRENLQRRATG